MKRRRAYVPAARRGLVEIEIDAPSKRKARLIATIGLPTDCYLCGVAIDNETAVLEHVHPKARKGEDLPENYRWACKRCNRIKSTFTLPELIDFAQRLLSRYPLG